VGPGGLKKPHLGDKKNPPSAGPKEGDLTPHADGREELDRLMEIWFLFNPPEKGNLTDTHSLYLVGLVGGWVRETHLVDKKNPVLGGNQRGRGTFQGRAHPVPGACLHADGHEELDRRREYPGQ